MQFFGLCVEHGFALLLLLFLQGLDHSIDGCYTICLCHIGQGQQRVLQFNGAGVGHEFVEHLRAQGEFCVVRTLLVEQSDGLAIAALGIGKALFLPVDIT